MDTDLRRKIRMSGLFQWQVAEKIGISEATLNRWLRPNSSEENKRKIVEAIKNMVEITDKENKTC